MFYVDNAIYIYYIFKFLDASYTIYDVKNTYTSW